MSSTNTSFCQLSQYKIFIWNITVLFSPKQNYNDCTDFVSNSFSQHLRNIHVPQLRGRLIWLTMNWSCHKNSKELSQCFLSNQESINCTRMSHFVVFQCTLWCLWFWWQIWLFNASIFSPNVKVRELTITIHIVSSRMLCFCMGCRFEDDQLLDWEWGGSSTAYRSSCLLMAFS